MQGRSEAMQDDLGHLGQDMQGILAAIWENARYGGTTDLKLSLGTMPHIESKGPSIAPIATKGKGATSISIMAGTHIRRS